MFCQAIANGMWPKVILQHIILGHRSTGFFLMPLPLEEMGGLTAGEISARILMAKVETGQMLDDKLSNLNERIGDRLSKQDEKLENIVTTVLEIKQQGMDREKDHIAYRVDMQARVVVIEDNVKSMSAWFTAFRLLSLIRENIVVGVKDSKEFLMAIAALTGAWLTFVNFFHTLWPEYIRPWFLQHKF